MNLCHFYLHISLFIVNSGSFGGKISEMQPEFTLLHRISWDAGPRIGSKYKIQKIEPLRKLILRILETFGFRILKFHSEIMHLNHAKIKLGQVINFLNLLFTYQGRPQGGGSFTPLKPKKLL